MPTLGEGNWKTCCTFSLRLMAVRCCNKPERLLGKGALFIFGGRQYGGECKGSECSTPFLHCSSPTCSPSLWRQVPAYRARVGCWTQRNVTFRVVSTGFRPAGEHCMSFEAWFFSLCSQMAEPGRKYCPLVCGRFCQSRRDAEGLVKGAFSTGHLHSQCGSSLTGEGLPLWLEQKSHFSPTLQDVGVETWAIREDTCSGVYTIPTQK